MHHFNVEQLKATCYSFFTTEGAQIITTRSNPLSLDMLRSTTLTDSVCVCVCVCVCVWWWQTSLYHT